MPRRRGLRRKFFVGADVDDLEASPGRVCEGGHDDFDVRILPGNVADAYAVGSLTPGVTFEQTLCTLREHNERLMNRSVIDQVLRPLAQAISAK